LQFRLSQITLKKDFKIIILSRNLLGTANVFLKRLRTHVIAHVDDTFIFTSIFSFLIKKSDRSVPNVST